jgi:thioredoxin-like negative regulator of GroEL
MIALMLALAVAPNDTQIEAYIKALKDKDKAARKAAAEALEKVDDKKGLAIKPLGEVLNNKAEDPEIRYAAAKALGKAQFKHDALEAFITCITSITNKDRDLHKFGADVTDVLNKFSGEDFGKGKQTPSLWEQWWADNKEKYKQEDAKKRAAK